MKYSCPVCGFPELVAPPRAKHGGGSFEICPSCGFQFGVTDDDDGFTCEQWREKWRKAGMTWSSRRTPPKNWNAAEQLKTLPAPARRNPKK